MKTKIIYISGNEIFDMADIRNAFDEVRNALSLGPDTVLFGVPVDHDDALNASEPVADIKPVVTPVVDNTQNVIEPEIKPEKKSTTRRAHKSDKVVPISDAITGQTITDKEPTHTEEIIPASEPEPAPVVPILSVLGSKSDDDKDDEFIEPIVEPKQAEPKTDDIDIVNAESVTITDMIADEAPSTEPEKTLEELLESMTPLGEDADKPNNDTSVDNNKEDIEPDTKSSSDDDIDMALEKLATEFVENQDKINIPAKPAARGKIGKLKNILPFKKAKHDDSGLMGDLFGWAGVAANDEDFTIPGFFK